MSADVPCPVAAFSAIPHRRTRRVGGAAIAVAGVVDLGSALTPPLRHRLEWVAARLPLAATQAAAALVALAGIALVSLAYGVRRGQRRAWRLSVALLSGSVVFHLVKGADLEEALLALGVVVY